MKIGVLTSSRADFGIYLPLLQKLKEDAFFELQIIAFGTHLSEAHGYTISEIEQYDLGNIHKIVTIPASDSPEDITKSIGETTKSFADFWSKQEFDLVFCLRPFCLINWFIVGMIYLPSVMNRVTVCNCYLM